MKYDRKCMVEPANNQLISGVDCVTFSPMIVRLLSML